MKFVFYTNSISPHQLPLAKELVGLLGAANYRYVYTTPQTKERRDLGWNQSAEPWIICERDNPVECRALLESCDVLMSGVRDIPLFEKRSSIGHATIYCSERWFKPIEIGVGGRYRCSFDGRMRMLVPSYRKMVKRFVRLVKDDPNFMLLPMGIHAACDFAWLLECKIQDFERFPGGRLLGNGKFLDKMRLWGYFVAPSNFSRAEHVEHGDGKLRVLWVGRMLDWKRVDAIIKAAKHVPIDLFLYGTGPEKKRLIGMAQWMGNVFFHAPVPIHEVRKLMHEHGVYVLASNKQEGWGAVVSEALEEGMRVVGTHESGASATMLPSTNLFHAGDWRALANLLSKEVPQVGIERWTARSAAAYLVKEFRLV